MEKTGEETLKALRDKGFQVEFRSHAQAILTVDFAEAVEELEAVLSGLSIPIEEIVGSGGGSGAVAYSSSPPIKRIRPSKKLHVTSIWNASSRE